MATIEEMNNSMTLYYSKSSGEIKRYATGIQDMNYFGTDKDDFSVIWDFVVLAIDDYVINNMNCYKINLTTKELEVIPGAVPDYPIATN